MLKIENVFCVHEREWSRFVAETYGRPYDLQQQDGCKPRGVEYVTVAPLEPSWGDRYDNNSVPEVVNHETMGVSLKAWLARDPDQGLAGDPNLTGSSGAPTNSRGSIELWWERNFYPDLDMVAYDLCSRGLLEPGRYIIIIDW